ncbi:MAG: hypothetical protein WDW38_009782 [Sanguina aurantia]
MACAGPSTAPAILVLLGLLFVGSAPDAVSTGAPALAVTRGVTDTTGTGQSLQTKCSTFAVNSADYKLCINGKTVTYVPGNGVSFVNATACKAPLTSGVFHVSDANCRFWGFEDQASCAYKDDTGNALTVPGSTNCPAAPLPSAVAQAGARSSSG